MDPLGEPGSDAQPLTSQGRCPFCKCKIHVIEEGGAVIIKAAVIKINSKRKVVCAKCPKCKHWLIVPLQYRPDHAVGT